MKELSIEEKAKAYDEALKNMRKFRDALSNHEETDLWVLKKEIVTDIEYYFPELKESEDKKIRKNLITFFKNEYGTNSNARFAGIKVKGIIAWLEKQGEKPQGKSALESWKDMRLEVYQQASGNRHEYNYSDDATKMFSLNDIDEIFERIAESREEKPADNVEPTDYNSIDPTFFKATDNVEPKFKVGDWVVNKFGDSWHIDSFDKKNYQVSDGKGNYNYFPISKQDEMHLWTIQEAKDGDVLASDNKNCPFIYRTKTVFGSPVAYCGVRSDGLFISESPKDHQWRLKSEVQPATKEQRDLLFKKMKEAGYEWDEIKNELKKIEQKSATMSLDEAIEHCKEKSCGNNACALEHKQLKKWLNELKELKEQNPAWREEDIRMSSAAMELITICPNLMASHSVSKSSVIAWLKSLKERYTWKPSDEQMDALHDAAVYVDKSMFPHPKGILMKLYKQLKKL